MEDPYYAPIFPWLGHLLHWEGVATFIRLVDNRLLTVGENCHPTGTRSEPYVIFHGFRCIASGTSDHAMTE